MQHVNQLDGQRFVTVLMAVHNGEDWLQKSIESVLKQTYSNFEFIIVDDGSQDNSRKIIERFALDDSRIRLFHKGNTGLTDSLNYGLARARGVWIARLDADDICRADRLQKQVNIASKNAELVLIGSGINIIDEQGHFVKTHLYPPDHSALLYCLAHALPFFAHSSSFFNLNLAKNVGGYRSQFLRSQDLDLWLRLAECGKIASIKEPLVSVRKHNNQISSENTGQLQTVFSHIAMASYWSRHLGWPDPAEENNDEDFSRFKDYVESQLSEAGVFETREKIISIKARIDGSRSQLIKILLFAVTAFKSPIIVFAYLKNRAFGSKLPKQLARKWMM